MNIYHLKRIRNKYQYKFIDGVLHVFNHKSKSHEEYKFIHRFVSEYVHGFVGMISAINYDRRILRRIKAREYYHSLTQTELKIKEI